MIRNCWEHITFLEKYITEIGLEITAHLEPYQEEFELIQTIPGVSGITASAIIAEIGVDMDPFPTADHLASWAGVAPGNTKVPVKKSTRTRKGNPHVKTAFVKLLGPQRSQGSLNLPSDFGRWPLGE
jgi:transposase